MEIKKYQRIVNSNLDNFLTNKINNEKMRDIIDWSLKGGKRLRSMIVIDITNTMNNINNSDIDNSKASISCEFLHTASLIIDDLPCMDNDNYRRGIKTVHYKYGSDNAYFISGFMISQVVKLLKENINDMKKTFKSEYVNKIQEKIINNYITNYNIAILGQYVDIYPLKKSNEENINFIGQIKEEYLRKIILDKTAPFFEISFMAGYLMSGGDLNKYQDIIDISQLFGIIFQISDDFEDQEQDMNKSCRSLVQNYVIVVGKEKALKDFYQLSDLFIKKMKELKLYSKLFEEIIQYLLNRVEKYK